MPVPQRQLVDEDGPQREATGIRQALRRDLAISVEDASELLVEVLDCKIR